MFKNQLSFVGLMIMGLSSCVSNLIAYEAVVQNVIGHHLFLDNGKEVALVGVHIPLADEINYRKEWQQYIFDLLQGKNVKVIVKIKKGKHGYPPIDNVEVYLDDLNVNEFLLENGHAFFEEDHWSPKEKSKYRILEKQAKKDQKGLWKEKATLEIWAVRHENWSMAYPPECPKVQNIPEENLVVYYNPLPFVRGGIGRDVLGECSELWVDVR